MSIIDQIRDRLLGKEIERRVGLAVRAVDDFRDKSYSSSTYPRDRYDYDRETVLADALEAWRINPLARRIVELISQYVVGGGITVESDHEATHDFIQDWWTHRLNNMPVRMYEWCEELSRSGELFILISTDPSGMSYMRAVPAADIQEIETAVNDLEQEIRIVEKPNLIGQGDRGSRADGRPPLQGSTMLEGRSWPVYNEMDEKRLENGSFDTVMVHYAVNRPVGAKHGESDLAPLLRWLVRYASWLEDRARLNRYRNTFIFWVKAKFASAEDRLRRQAELNANPPNPGSLLVSDDTETWSVLNPMLQSHEAATDGLALKKMIAAGAGVPLHFIAEPEGATRTTAESAGGPTFRHYQQRQNYFIWMIEDLAKIAIKRRKMVDRSVSTEEIIKINGSDISARDNASLATAASTIINAYYTLRAQGLIDDAELLRIAYKFSGELIDVEEMLKRGKVAGKLLPPPDASPGVGAPGSGGVGQPPGNDPTKNLPGIKMKPIEIDPITGEPVGLDE